MAEREIRHAVVMAIPVAVPLTMAALFAALRRCVTPRAAYNGGFAIYWLGPCLAIPLWVLGPREAARLLLAGRRLPCGYVALRATPVAGAIGTQLIPKRQQLDPQTAAVMVGTAIVNAVGEEVLWRGLFMRELDRRPWVAMLWSMMGFSAWHFAPQLILPSGLGRGRFVVGSAVVGIASTKAAWKSGGLRQVVVAHAITDVCGVTAARFRLGK